MNTTALSPTTSRRRLIASLAAQTQLTENLPESTTFTFCSTAGYDSAWLLRVETSTLLDAQAVVNAMPGASWDLMDHFSPGPVYDTRSWEGTWMGISVRVAAVLDRPAVAEEPPQGGDES